MEFKLCKGECDRVLPLNKFSPVGRENKKVRRNVCNECHGRRCYQTRLKQLKFKGDKSIVICNECKSLYKKKHGVDLCVSCRDKNGLINYWKREERVTRKNIS